jgi:hypothetical protein
MTHTDHVFETLAYRRNIGASPREIRTIVAIHGDPKRTARDDINSLQKLEKQGLIFKVANSWFLTAAGEKQARGPCLSATWQHSDAWIFGAILFNRETDNCRLAEIIGAADVINHAIPTLVEMHGGLNRLVSARLIRVRGEDCFSPTASGLKLLSKAQRLCGRRLLEVVEGLRKLLDCPCCGVRLKRVRWQIQLDEATLKHAYDTYRSWWPRK